MPFINQNSTLCYFHPQTNQLLRTWVEPTFYPVVKEMVIWLVDHDNLDKFPVQVEDPFGGGWTPSYAGPKACKAFYDKYGLWPKAFNKGLTTTTLVHFGLEPYKPFLFNIKGLNTSRARDIYRSRLVISQLMRDGLRHLIPLAMLLGEDPKHMKLLLGKSLWKKLARNSVSRNMLIYSACNSFRNITPPLEDDDQLYKRIAMAQELPSTILKYASRMDMERLLLAKTVAPTYKRAAEIAKTNEVIILQDTIRMASQLGLKFNPLPYDQGRVARKHDEYIKRLRMRQYSPIPFQPQHVFEQGEWQATRLNNALDIAAEAAAMHHCVAAYVGSCKEGRYYVYSLRRNGERYATIGINRFISVSMDQIQGVCNAHVDTSTFDRVSFMNEVNEAHVKETAHLQRPPNQGNADYTQGIAI